MRKLLNWTYSLYKVPIIVTENGYVENGVLIDDARISYLEVRKFLTEFKMQGILRKISKYIVRNARID